MGRHHSREAIARASAAAIGFAASGPDREKWFRDQRKMAGWGD